MRIRMFLLGACIHVASINCSEPLSAITFFSPRSQTTNAAQELIDDFHFVHQYEVKPSHFFTSNISFYQSLHEDQLANIIFGSSTLIIEGSFVDNREDAALLADYFGLSPTFKSVIEIEPLWRSVYVPFTFYIALDQMVGGMYLRMSIPYVWNQSKLRIDEDIINNGIDTAFPEHYMAFNVVTAPYTSFKQALQGTATYGFVTQPLLYGRYIEEQTTQNIANTTWDLGWNIELDTGHVGVKIRTVTPNSTRPTGQTLYEPLVGNGHHWEFGGGLNGHTRVWEKDYDHELSIYFNILLTHLFDARQQRSFDVQDGCAARFFSRYMLVKEFDQVGAFTGAITPVINHTTLPCEVNVNIEFDAAVMFAYSNKNFVFNFGYNAWVRTKENITLLRTVSNKTFGLKGIQNAVNSSNQLSVATESTASIFGNNFAQQNMVVDIPSPVFLTHTDIDVNSAASPGVFSHKLFTYLGYTKGKLHKARSVQPCIGIGSEIEFQGYNGSNIDTNFVENLTLSQWSIFLKVGLLFG